MDEDKLKKRHHLLMCPAEMPVLYIQLFPLVSNLSSNFINVFVNYLLVLYYLVSLIYKTLVVYVL